MKKILFLTTFLFLCFISFSKAEAYSECNFSFVDKLPAEIPYTHSNGITYDSVIAVAGDTGSGSCSTTKYAIYMKSSASMPYFKEVNQTTLSLYFPNSPVLRDQYMIYATSTNGGTTWSAFSSTLGNVLTYDLDGTQRVEYHFRSSKDLFFTSLYDYDFTSSGISRFNLGYVTAGQEILSSVPFGLSAPSGESIPEEGSIDDPGNPENTINSHNENSVSVIVGHELDLGGGKVHVKVSDGSGNFAEGEADISGSDIDSTLVSGIDASSLDDGVITMISRVEDSAGNFSDWSAGTSGTKDVQLPDKLVGLSFPDDLIGASKGDSVDLDFTGDPGADIFYTVSDPLGGNMEGSLALDPEGNGEITLDFSSFSDGVISAEAYVADTAWNHSPVETALTEKDTEAPDAPEYLTEEDLWLSSNPLWNIDFSDNHSLGSVAYQLDGADGSWIALAENISEESFQEDWSFSEDEWKGLSEGRHFIYFRLVDQAGNVFETPSDLQAFSFRKDTQGPLKISGLGASLLEGEWTRENDLDISWSSSEDDGSGIAGYSYVLDRDSETEPDGSVETSVENYSVEDLESAENWYFHVRAVDSLGNLSETATVGPFKIDTKNPDLSHKKISEASAGEKITFEASADDDGLSGIEEVRLFYKLGSDDWEDSEMNDSGGKKFRKSLEIPSDEEGNLKYFIMAVDSVGNKTYICDGGKTDSKSEAKEDPIKVEIIPVAKSSEASSGVSSSLTEDIQKDFGSPSSEVAGAETQNNNPPSSSGTRIIRGSDDGGGTSEASKILIFSIIGSILVIVGIIWMRVRAARKRKLAPAMERNSYWDQLVK